MPRAPELEYLEDLKDRTPPVGYQWVMPSETQLFVDVDDRTVFDERLKRFENWIDGYIGISNIEITPSRSPGHFHAVINLYKSVSDLERIALQAILGGDPMREFVSLLRVREGIADPTMFFEKES